MLPKTLSFSLASAVNLRCRFCRIGNIAVSPLETVNSIPARKDVSAHGQTIADHSLHIHEPTNFIVHDQTAKIAKAKAS